MLKREIKREREREKSGSGTKVAMIHLLSLLSNMRSYETCLLYVAV